MEISFALWTCAAPIAADGGESTRDAALILSAGPLGESHAKDGIPYLKIGPLC